MATAVNEATLMQSPAWLLRGVDNLPGEMKLAAGRLSFTAHGRGSLGKSQLEKLARDAKRPDLVESMRSTGQGVVFDLPLAEATVSFPWYYFSGGCKVRVDGFQHKISFGEPTEGASRLDSPEDLAFFVGLHDAAGQAGGDLREAGHMRASGKAWKSRLLA